MSINTRALLVLGGGLCIATAALGASRTPSGAAFDSEVVGTHRPVLLDGVQTGAFAFEHDGRVKRLYGHGISHGPTADESARRFVDTYAPQLAVRAEDLAPRAAHLPAGHAQPIMYDEVTGLYKFTVLYFEQERDGIPVANARMTVLVRNEPGFPLVLANPDVRDLGDFAVDAAARNRAPSPAGRQNALTRVDVLSPIAGQPRINRTARVIWAGTSGDPVAPRLADDSVVANGVDKWRIVTDAATGEVLHEESLICNVDVSGNVSGNATEGFGSEQCENEVPTPLPYIGVDGGPAGFVHADANGDFTLSSPISNPQLSVDLTGLWFDVFDYQAQPTSEILFTTPPSAANILFNSANDDEIVRAQVNAYVESNRVRDAVVGANPVYPSVLDQAFPVTVNRTDGFCPGNAWYDPDEVSINFCLADGGTPNTAWSSVIHHEYGHHLVAAGGSGQGAYGEGMGDVLSIVILDTHFLGWGFNGDCSSSLRDAVNSIQYPCSGGSHFCGQLISGCVWETRNELVVTEPEDYLQILQGLAVNSILLHSGSDIDPSITIDWLTLDDDDANIFNGTPHFDEIDTGFSEHGMPGPALDPIGFSFPNGRPLTVNPNVDAVIRVNVLGLASTPLTGTGDLSYSLDGGGTVTVPMNEIGSNEYEATLPAAPCDSVYEWWVSADASAGGTYTDPPGAPGTRHVTIVASGFVAEFTDDFEVDEGWTTSVSGATSGQWQRGVPVNDSDWSYDPGSDGDGSGQAFLTQNELGNTDVDDGAVTLVSPTLDLSSTNLTISYDYFLRLTDEDGTDRLLVEVSPSGDAGPWTQIVVHDTDNGLSWTGHEITSTEISGLGVTLTANSKLRFTANDGDAQSIVEAGLDGLQVVRTECIVPPPCPEDLSGDDGVGFSDLNQLLTAWGSCPGCPEDFDGDGTVGFSDLNTLLTAWGPCG